MINTKTLVGSALAGVAMLGVQGIANAQSGPAPVPDFSFEKCYGISKWLRKGDGSAARAHGHQTSPDLCMCLVARISWACADTHAHRHGKPQRSFLESGLVTSG
jgi:hypothetical protein